jgi:hypothetical protein
MLQAVGEKEKYQMAMLIIIQRKFFIQSSRW